MGGAEAFDGTLFLGLARNSTRDPYRLSLFAQHLETNERPLAFLAIHGGTLIVTDRRLLEFRPHLDVHGAWNVKEFKGYEVRREIPRADVSRVDHRVGRGTEPDAMVRIEDALILVTQSGPEEFLVSRGPESTLPPPEFEALKDAILGTHAK